MSGSGQEDNRIAGEGPRDSEICSSVSPPTAAAGDVEPLVRQRVRMRFAKEGDLRLIGHRDLVRTIERAFRRAGLRLGMSQGFHPKPRMSFPSALAVGIAGADEVMEVEWSENYTVEELQRRLASHGVPGLDFRSIELLPPGAAKARVRSTGWEIPVPQERLAETAASVNRLWAETTAAPTPEPAPAAGAGQPTAPAQSLESLALESGVLRVRLRAGPQGAANPRGVLAALGLGDLEQAGIHLTRSSVELEP
jgi:radical SAM-linked protein